MPGLIGPPISGGRSDAVGGPDIPFGVAPHHARNDTLRCTAPAFDATASIGRGGASSGFAGAEDGFAFSILGLWFRRPQVLPSCVSARIAGLCFCPGHLPRSYDQPGAGTTRLHSQ
jgi:hypothetical protein